MGRHGLPKYCHGYLGVCVVVLMTANVSTIAVLQFIVWTKHNMVQQAERSSNAFLSEPRGFLPEGNRKWNGTLPEGVAGGEMDNPEALENQFTLRYRPKHARLVKPLTGRRFLTIGIPTVRREGVDSGYLKNTIKSLLENMSPRERTNVTLLIYVADFNTSFQDTLVNYLSAVYPSELESGLILPLLSSIDDYPSLRNLPRNFNDSERRVQWRSKQVLDFAIMFYHCQNMSEYYMQIEDDVIVAENYVSKIRDFIALQEFVNTSWVTLQFSQLGFIGKLYRSSDLRRLADFLVLFYDQMPVDWLFGRFASLLSLPKMPLRRPTLFQHQGLQSTFLSKGPNRLRDELFEGELVLKHRGDDPPVRFCSDFEQYDTYKPSFAYNRTWSMEFYWGKTIEENKTFNIRFDRPQLIKDVEIMTGHPRHTNDILQHGVLEIGFARNPRECTCSRYVQVGVFHKGHSIAEFGRGVHNRVECIRMRVTKTQSEWLIIYNIILHLWV